MTAPDAGQPHVLRRPACTPAAIRAVLAANADAAVLHGYDEDLDAAYEQAREHGRPDAAGRNRRRWWFEADAWRDPGTQRQYVARVDAYRTHGPPPAGQLTTRQEVRARHGV